MKNEIWKAVKGYEGLYEVSNLGRVRSLARNTTKGKIRKLSVTQGYYYVGLWKDGKFISHRVNRLVAEAFVPNCDGKPMVNHLDENKLNNRADNLEWCTHIENCHHGTAIQRTRAKLVNHPLKSKAVEQYTNEGNLVSVFPSIREAERQTGIRHRGISFCCNGKEATAGGYIWKFA